MDNRNWTALNELILTGITDHPDLQAPFFGLFLNIYVTSVLGNMSMIVLTKVNNRLQTPMYFFLRHLAFTDLGYSAAMGPKMLANIVTNQNTIPYKWCATQLAFFIVFIISELFILSAMAYDRYVAISNPLLYSVVMSPRVCWVLVTIPYLYNTFLSLITTIKIFISSFCVLVSYTLILAAILRMNSADGRHKAFSTCRSHLTVVVILYGTLFFMYVQPKSSHSFESDKLASVFYTLVIPMLNSMIYSLRNKEVKGALHRIWNNVCKLCL
ncbi:Olfactory receptor 8K3 [Heterocephalus glaber]|uniref:Olfactory receptor 8K3 n=1 Tax=Heterocephalus glaber TaxID=10181 RepID=G5AJN4_HETGA|nr:Olfactory receptor 8K3 [Heterocephalus glaber]